MEGKRTSTLVGRLLVLFRSGSYADRGNTADDRRHSAAGVKSLNLLALKNEPTHGTLASREPPLQQSRRVRPAADPGTQPQDEVDRPWLRCSRAAWKSVNQCVVRGGIHLP